MEEFKHHIAKQIVEGKIMTSKSECGRNSFTKNGSVNMIHKTNLFRSIYNEDKSNCCLICSDRALKQNRI